MKRKSEEEILEEQNDFLRKLLASFEDLKAGRVRPFKTTGKRRPEEILLDPKGTVSIEDALRRAKRRWKR